MEYVTDKCEKLIVNTLVSLLPRTLIYLLLFVINFNKLRVKWFKDGKLKAEEDLEI